MMSTRQLFVFLNAVSNPILPAGAVQVLAGSNLPRVRKIIAERPNTDVGILTQLSQDADIQVRVSVALNNSTPVEVLEKLSHDDDWLVRHGVAENVRTPKHVWQQLLQDPNADVARRASSSFLLYCGVRLMSEYRV